MIGSIAKNNINHFMAANANNLSCDKKRKEYPTFGDSYSSNQHGTSIFQPIKDLVVSLTDDMVGMVGFNAALWWLQDFVNGKVLVGKINKHYTDKIPHEITSKLPDLAESMKKDKGLEKVVIDTNGTLGEAFFTHKGNFVSVGKDQYTSLFHELGHAFEENKTVFWKYLQRFRTNPYTKKFGGNYTLLALGLYALLSQRKKTYTDEDYHPGIKAKIKSFLNKSDAIVPLLAFSPELITEAKASHEGLKFLRKTIGKESSVYKNIRNSYIACFGTYLFIPVSIMLLDGIRHEANKIRQKQAMQREQVYF